MRALHNEYNILVASRSNGPNEGGNCKPRHSMTKERLSSGDRPWAIGLEPQPIQEILTGTDYLFVVDPDVTVAREDVDVGRRLPIRSGLTAVRIAEGEMDAGD